MELKTYVLHCSVVPVMVSGSLFVWNTTAKLEKKSGLESREPTIVLLSQPHKWKRCTWSQDLFHFVK